MSAAPQPALVEFDGFLVDPDTGEVVEAVVPEGFVVKDAESLDWALGRLLDVEARKAAVESSEAVLKARAVLANAERLAADCDRRLAVLRRRFEPEIETFVRSALEGRKERTVKTLHGRVSLRRVPAKLQVADHRRAGEYLARYAPEALRFEVDIQVLASDRERTAVELLGLGLDPVVRPSFVPEAVKGRLMSDPLDAAGFGFVVVPPSETMKIETGVPE